ncbi:hypothetical protein MTO96_026895 [Rhipicephalus appendiculatus]
MARLSAVFLLVLSLISVAFGRKRQERDWSFGNIGGAFDTGGSGAYGSGRYTNLGTSGYGAPLPKWWWIRQLSGCSWLRQYRLLQSRSMETPLTSAVMGGYNGDVFGGSHGIGRAGAGYRSYGVNGGYSASRVRQFGVDQGSGAIYGDGVFGAGYGSSRVNGGYSAGGASGVGLYQNSGAGYGGRGFGGGYGNGGIGTRHRGAVNGVHGVDQGYGGYGSDHGYDNMVTKFAVSVYCRYPFSANAQRHPMDKPSEDISKGSSKSKSKKKKRRGSRASLVSTSSSEKRKSAPSIDAPSAAASSSESAAGGSPAVAPALLIRKGSRTSTTSTSSSKEEERAGRVTRYVHEKPKVPPPLDIFSREHSSMTSPVISPPPEADANAAQGTAKGPAQAGAPQPGPAQGQANTPATQQGGKYKP